MSRTVLALTDLTARSDAALVWADSVAAACGWSLHVAHAVELADRELARTGDDLHRVHHAIVTADAAARAQLQRTLGERAALTERVIDLDGAWPAMQRRAAVLQPALMVLPRVVFSADDAFDSAGRNHALAQIQCDVLLVDDSAPSDARHMVAILHQVTLDARTIQCAGRWSHILKHAIASSSIASTPALELVLLADDGSLPPALQEPAPDLVIIPGTLLSRDEPDGSMFWSLRKMLRETSAPVLVLRGEPQVQPGLPGLLARLERQRTGAAVEHLPLMA